MGSVSTFFLQNLDIHGGRPFFSGSSAGCFLPQEVASSPPQYVTSSQLRMISSQLGLVLSLLEFPPSGRNSPGYHHSISPSNPPSKHLPFPSAFLSHQAF